MNYKIDLLKLKTVLLKALASGIMPVDIVEQIKTSEYEEPGRYDPAVLSGLLDSIVTIYLKLAAFNKEVCKQEIEANIENFIIQAANPDMKITVDAMIQVFARLAAVHLEQVTGVSIYNGNVIHTIHDKLLV